MRRGPMLYAECLAWWVRYYDDRAADYRLIDKTECDRSMEQAEEFRLKLKRHNEELKKGQP